MKKNKKQVIVNADDFGLTPGVTAGIFYAHRRGIVSSATAMVNTPFAKEALQEAKKHLGLGIGLHWVLDTGKPVAGPLASLTDHAGYFLKGKELVKTADKQDLKAELEAQLARIYEWYGPITHIDSHHHMHLHIPNALEVMEEVAEAYQLPVRGFSETTFKANISKPNFLRYDFYGDEHVTVKYLSSILSDLGQGVTEIMCHPAFMDCWLQEKSSYHYPRMKEIAVLTDNEIQQEMKVQQIELIHFGGLADGH